MPPFGDMKADTKCVFDLLSGRTCWHVPQYQRPYVWGPRQVEQLLADIWQYFEMSLGRPDGKTPKPKFVGVLVTAMNDEQELRQEIVDGQQRTITLILLVRAAVYLGHQMKKNPLGPQETTESVASAAKDIGEIGRMLYKSSDSKDTPGPVLTLFGGELSDWFSRTFLTDDDLVLRDEFQQAIHLQQHPPRQKLITLKGYFMDACMTAHKGLRGRLEASMGGIVRLADFLKYLIRYTVVTHMETRDRESAFDIFDSLNSTGVRLTEVQKLKAFMSCGASEISEAHSEKWNHAEEMIGRFWGGCSTADQGKLAATEPLRIFLVTIAEIAEAETATNVLLEAGHKPRWVTDLKGYFLHDFRIGVGSQRQELFDGTRKPRARELALFFERHFNQSSIHAFCSFLDLEDQCWANFYLLEDDRFAKVRCEVQHIVAVLRHLGHLGLDQAWIRPAYAFTNKYLCRTSEGGAQQPLPTAQEVLKFFTGLERLAAYIVFAVPRMKRKKDNIAREAGEKDVDVSAAEDEQVPYLQDVQLHFYRDLLTRIATKPVQNVLEWLDLSPSEEQLFARRFPSSFSAVKYGRRAIYALLRAEVCLFRGGDTLHKGLIEQLPEFLFNTPPRDVKKVTRAFSEPASYRQVVLDHIMPLQNTSMRSEEGYDTYDCDKDNYSDLKDCLGNLTALAVVDDSSYRARLDWSQKKAVYAEQPLKFTNGVVHHKDFGPTQVRGREQRFRMLLKKAWGIPLAMEFGRSASSATASSDGRAPLNPASRRTSAVEQTELRETRAEALTGRVEQAAPRATRATPFSNRVGLGQRATWPVCGGEGNPRIWSVEGYLNGRGGHAPVNTVVWLTGEKEWFLEKYFGIFDGWVYSFAHQETWFENREAMNVDWKNREWRKHSKRQKPERAVPAIEVVDDEGSDYESERKKRARRERFGNS